jgi:hypothetical protein
MTNTITANPGDALPSERRELLEQIRNNLKEMTEDLAKIAAQIEEFIGK